MVARFRIPLLVIALSGLAAAAPAADAPVSAPPRLLPGMGHHHRTVATRSREAQRWFDQGLTLAFAFNHDEAIRSFTEAAQLDPTCAMACWGVALCNGPHINNPMMDEDHSRAAWRALQQARGLVATATPMERELIDALGHRYAWPAPENRAPLDAAYADAMRAVWHRHPDDADAGTLFAESMMDLRPWDLWTVEGTAQPGTDEIVATLEEVLRLRPTHPGANHLYVHAVEASPHPEKALPSAQRLKTLVPGAGHLVHMPAHIYARVGRWHDAADANVQAIEADRRYRELSPRQGFYNIYMAHDHQFLAFTAMMEGRSEVAIREARAMVAGIPPEFAEKMAFIADGYLALPYEALMRFGKWEEILQEPEPPAYLPICRAMRHFARGVALAALGRVDEAKAELQTFQSAREAVAPDAIVGNNPANAVLDLAARVLAGELAWRQGDAPRAVSELEEAVRIEDTLHYDEPPDWIIPVRHQLGAILLKAGRFEEARATYEEDLRRWPENGWSLHGLAESLRSLGGDAGSQAASTEVRARKVWSRADVPLGMSCACVR